MAVQIWNLCKDTFLKNEESKINTDQNALEVHDGAVWNGMIATWGKLDKIVFCRQQLRGDLTRILKKLWGISIEEIDQTFPLNRFKYL